jgi:hypothetical protein
LPVETQKGWSKLGFWWRNNRRIIWYRKNQVLAGTVIALDSSQRSSIETKGKATSENQLRTAYRREKQQCFQ